MKKKKLNVMISLSLAATLAMPSAGQAMLDKPVPEEYRTMAFLQHKQTALPPATIQASKAAKPAAAQPKASPRIAMPSPQALIVMIRSSVVALGHANVTNNYSVLNQMGSRNFRQENSPAKLSKLFAPFRSNKIDLAPVVFLTPQLTQAPKIENGRLRMIGFFPSEPMRVNFDLMFEPSEGIWKLYGIAVNLNRITQQQKANTPRPQAGSGNPAQGR